MPTQNSALRQRTVSGRTTRIVVIDDSAVVRGFLSRWIDDATDLELVGLASDGVEGIAVATAAQPDVIVLDIEMPKLDGLQALPQLLKASPRSRVLMSSRLTVPGARTCLQCLELGAADVIAKPAFQKNLGALNTFRQDLIGKIRGLSCVKSSPVIALKGMEHASQLNTAAASNQTGRRQTLLRNRMPHVILIGASTGGPQAIGEFLAGARALVPHVPVVIAQHMPGIFTAVFAEHLVRTTGFVVKESVHGEILKRGTVYIAPGGHHTLFTGRGDQARFVISDEAPIRYTRPSIDLLLESGAAAFGARTWCVLLTGMGEDGLIGARAVSAAGGQIFAQDESSSVVWGIPGAVVRAGLADVTDRPRMLADSMQAMIAGVQS